MMSSKAATTFPKAKHLDIRYKPKSYTNGDFIIPPESCLTETEKLEYILADVPSEIWTNIWEFKLIAEKREILFYKVAVEKMRREFDLHVDTIKSDFYKIEKNTYGTQEHKYLNYYNMRRVLSDKETIDEDFQYMFREIDSFHVKDYMKNVESVMDDYNKTNPPYRVELPKSYMKMKIATFIKKVMCVAGNNHFLGFRLFFNYVMSQIVINIRNVGEYGVCILAKMDADGEDEVGFGKKYTENIFLPRATLKKGNDLEIKKEVYDDIKNEKMRKYIELYFPPEQRRYVIMREGVHTTVNIYLPDHSLTMESPHFYHKERSCLAGIDCD